MRIGVTGATGQLGKSVLNELRNYSFEAIPLPRKLLDLTDLQGLDRILDDLDLDFVINCAAFTAVDEAETKVQEVMSINSYAPAQLARYSNSRNIGFIHISTDSVFSSDEPHFFKPTDQPNPINSYAASKLDGEKGVLTEYPGRAIIIRTAWLYGEGGHKFVQAILQKGNEGEMFEVVDDQFGQPTPTTSLAKFIVFLIQNQSPGGIYHFASSNFTSRLEWARKILEFRGLDPQIISGIPTSANEIIAKRPRYSLLEVSDNSTSNYSSNFLWEDELKNFLGQSTLMKVEHDD
jgi:dTDP-4-dehydrorhamnose reductase